tara:strand:- start:248 stop:436 length:189 start_codon:yes stop_codon:yes gene_type:complete
MEKLLKLVEEIQQELTTLKELLTEANEVELEEPVEFCSKCRAYTEGLYNYNGEFLYCKGCLN